MNIQKKIIKVNHHLIFFFALIFSVFSNYSYAQNPTVNANGTVYDGAGNSLPGVTVSLKSDKTTGVVTDLDGKFSLDVPLHSTLVLSYVGFETKEIRIENSTPLPITMKDVLNELSEVVVVAYGTQKKITVTGSVSSLGSDQLLKTPVASLGLSLAGKVTGLSSVQQSGAPGADDPMLFVRGIGTLSTTGSAPLVLVDGVERTFTQIDPNEVEDITVLKDASATAVFGVRGANGVILVTTKRGVSGKTKITATTSFGVQQPTLLLDFVNSYDYATYFNESQLNDGVLPANLKFQPHVLDAFKNQNLPLVYPDIKWLDYMLKDFAPQTQHNINFSGGTNNVRYFVSTGFLSQAGLFKTFNTDKNNNFDYQRFNYRANIDIDLTKTNQLSLNLGGRLENRNYPFNGEEELFRYLQASTPFGGAGIHDGKWVVTNSANILEPGRDGLDKIYGRGFTKASKNVLNLDLIFLQKLDFITKGLDLRIKGSYNNSFDQRKTITASEPSYSAVKQSDGSYELQKNGDSSLPGFNESYSFGLDWYAETALNYNSVFGNHQVTALLLYNQYKKYYPAVYKDIPTGYVGLVGRVTYNYKTKYLLDVNMGYNGSENFAPGKRYGFFPSFSAGWIVSSERFLANQKVINYLKLRASVGVVGNDRMGDHRFLYSSDTYLTSFGYYFGTNVTNPYSGIKEGVIGNPNVTWEKALKRDIGVDLYVLNDRLQFNLDVFDEHRTDILITPKNTPIVFGQTAPPINYGIVDNRGYELSVKWQDKIGEDFTYYINPNVSYSKNVIVEQDEVRPNQPYLSSTGKSVGQLFGYDFFGFYNGAETEEAYKTKYGVDHFPTQLIPTGLKPGDAVYVDLDGDGRITADDQHAIGYPTFPLYTFGLNIGFTYKKFDFYMLWGGATKVSRKLDRLFRPVMSAQHNESMLQWSFDNRWTPETSNTATLPRASFASESNNTVDSRLWIVDASYLRLRNLEIAYNVNSKVLERLGVFNLRLFMNVYNLLTFTRNYPGGDPEQRRDQLDNMKYPNTKVLNLGFNVEF